MIKEFQFNNKTNKAQAIIVNQYDRLTITSHFTTEAKDISEAIEKVESEQNALIMQVYNLL